MQTSYIAKAASHPNAVAICWWLPKGVDMKRFPMLAPSKSLIDRYKSGEITEQEYADEYTRTVLNKLSPHETYDALGYDAILCCFEKPGEFCHRRIVAAWFEKHVNVFVPEMT